MQTNIGSLDRGLRIALGLALIGAALGGWIGPWGWLGLVPLLTGLWSRCPLYTLLGVHTGRSG
ncbi:YgaP family membrane protein [Pseudoduganella aquatica]|uniref:DUF2892 domain-containing protein n=1 Tax=Pseudoduganella aquatica TaxID=2660641 RepID=A0A7X4HDK5_9BURK|nr:DUF2892 domain-containing protein [Pseudoduganella aquatica]MYN08602.1 DUF2892 domain-containing protein [Pseudoduganella aquatica]